MRSLTRFASSPLPSKASSAPVTKAASNLYVVGQTLSELIATLPEEERVILTLHFLRQLPVAEISGKLGVPERAVNAVLASGRARLHAALNLPSQFPLG